MSATLLSLTLLATSAVVRADYFSTNPLVNKDVPYDKIPYQVMTDRDDPRGFQTGYNQCNSTTENQQSMCQTMFVNHIDDFCLWAPAVAGQTIAESEGEEVAWCSKKGHGTRLIPNGAITSVQFVQTKSYIQIAGTFNQAMLGIGGTDGGELDSGGQDGEGNPMGGLVYTNSFPAANGNNATFIQARHWSFFIGNNYFCGKVCDQTGSNPQGLCNNIYDRLGCDYNAPANVQAGTFEVCKGDDMMPVGTYVGADGATSTYHQPPSESDPIDYAHLPYTPTPAPTSSCTPYASAAIFTDIANVAAVGSASAAPTGSPSGSGAPSGSKSNPTGSVKPGSPTTGSPSSGASKPAGSGSSGALAFGASVGAVMAGFAVVVAAL
ncbi:hypothetical protein MIND_01243200 [Mycena indigotica]|uniref:Macrofage activating glycoprotein n=1 Tax=Mycena indigotica TaxID=2126181 RepID=A0A8H6S3M8_9AGAR|nr:uncharacterized protein MIND_01243200 [Mycena indigotica]KAF7292161.1 hypothetical protein MIND_01243200 [Mycena indigotica]